MSDVFLSYASADRSRMKPLVDALHQQGWSVWWDRTILPGEDWQRVIEAELAEARCIVVLWSENSIQSDWVRTEAYKASRRRVLVPAPLDNVTPPLAFERFQTGNLVDWSGVLPHAGVGELVRAVWVVLARSATFAQDGVTGLPLERGPTTELPAPRPLWRRGRELFSRKTVRVGGVLLACLAIVVLYLAYQYGDTHREANPNTSGNLPAKDFEFTAGSSASGNLYKGKITVRPFCGPGEVSPDRLLISWYPEPRLKLEILAGKEKDGPEGQLSSAAAYQHVVAVRVRFDKGAPLERANRTITQGGSEEFPIPQTATTVTSVEIDYLVMVNRFENGAWASEKHTLKWGRRETASSCRWPNR